MGLLLSAGNLNFEAKKQYACGIVLVLPDQFAVFKKCLGKPIVCFVRKGV